MPVTFSKTTCLNPLALAAICRDIDLPTDWQNRANTFDLRMGEAPGRGWVLLRRGDLDAVSLTEYNTLTFASSDRDSLVLQKVTLIGATCLTPAHLGAKNAAYLCEVVDRRYHLARIPCNVAYNVRHATTGDYLDETLNSAVAWTWEEVIENLWGMLDAGDVPDLPFTPDGNPENLVYWGGWAWSAVNDVLTRIGCAVRYWPVTDEFAFVRLGETDAESDAEAEALLGQRTWDSDPIDPVRGWRPENVRVVFQRSPLPLDGRSPFYTVDVALDPADGVVAGSYVQLADDLSAQGATGTPTNSSECAARAAERAADWQRKRQFADKPSLISYSDFLIHADVLFSSMRTRLVFDERGASKTEIRNDPDGSLEKWSPLTGVPKWWPPTTAASGSATPPFAVLTETTGPSSWSGREVSIAGGGWSASGTTGTNNARPFLIDGATFTPKPTANILLFEDRDGDLGYLPVQAADRVSSVDYPGYVSTGNQTWNGNKIFADAVEVNADANITTTAFKVWTYYSGGPQTLMTAYADGSYPYVEFGGTAPVQVVSKSDLHTRRLVVVPSGVSSGGAPGQIRGIGSSSLSYPYDPVSSPNTLAMFGPSGSAVLLTPDSGILGISTGINTATGEFTTSCDAYNYYTTEHSSPYGGYTGGTLGDGSGGYYFLNGLYIGGGSGGFGLPAGSQNGEIAYFNGTAWSVLSPPGSDGTYVLTATVSSGVLTLSWV